MKPGLGRRVAPDPRDGQHKALRLLAAEPPPDLPGYRYWWNLGSRLDQGDTGTCVAHAWVHLAENSPITRPGQLNPYQLYRELILLDEWYDNDHEASAADDSQLLGGSSVRAGAKAMQARGLIGEYLWAWDLETAVRWLLTKGPLVLGTNWYDSFYAPDDEGVLELLPYTSVVGGHAFIADGINVDKGLVRCLNSWGPNWGRNGAFYLPLELLERLIAEDGEACMATELAVQPIRGSAPGNA